MSHLTALPRANPMPADAAALLRRIADQIDRGEVADLVLAATVNGAYEMHFPSSLTDSLVLATLLQQRCVEKFRE